MSHYVVSFKSGSAGRFVANILWMLVQNDFYEVKFTKENSTHDDNPWVSTWTPENLLNTHNNSDVFSKWKFNCDYNGLFISHTYPNLREIQKNIPGLRTILITYSLSDLLEITANTFYKNIIPAIHSGDKTELIRLISKPTYEDWCILHLNLYHKLMILSEEFSQEFLNILIKRKYQNLERSVSSDSFFENTNSLPSSEDVLVIQYSELFEETSNGSYIALDKINAWFPYSGDHCMLLQNFKTYANNRKIILTTKLTNLYENN